MPRNGRRTLKVVVTLLAILFSGGCAQRTSPTASPNNMERALKSQIDLSQEEQFGSDSKDPSLLLVLENIQYGSFTKDHSYELLASFRHSSTPPHAAGLDRTIAAVYDVSTLKIRNQKTFAADEVSLYFLQGASGRSFILYMGATTYQGITTQVLELWRVDEDHWTSIPVSDQQLDDSYAYALMGDQTLLIIDGLETTAPDIIGSLVWDKEAAAFVPRPD